MALFLWIVTAEPCGQGKGDDANPEAQSETFNDLWHVDKGARGSVPTLALATGLSLSDSLMSREAHR